MVKLILGQLALSLQYHYVTFKMKSHEKGGFPMKKQATSTETFIDPVCLMKVNPGNKSLTIMYQMRGYYFCDEACRKAFEANPEKYLRAKTPKRKGWWGRYLHRLEKATGGKAPQCH